MKRRRSRGSSNSTANFSMESNGADVKVRGSAKQIFDKYEALARGAASGGSRVRAENYRQHAEHYLRMVNEMEEAKHMNRDGFNQENGKREPYPPRSNYSTKNPPDKESDEKAVPAALEVVQTDAGDPVIVTTESDTAAKDVPKSTSRRKAPVRNPAEVVKATE
ncbi:MAG: DUF4167 domain-containing protein [Hyphomonadaceae bacterium]|nr:DUF4167 domain-containing protein [Hyphomonadaceae bacterium]MBC6413285.1 DUF4167 domain-containing protein [Hyphomonadaceae bacterium]